MTMATAGSHLTEDRFRCSICLDVFTQPVSLPCGHNFCKACITDCWNSNVKGLCRCPMCKETYKTRPELRVNCFISEMVEQFRKTLLVTEEKEREDDVSGGMLCDVCKDTKMKAVKSCLVCFTSYCETHLEPHRRVQNLKTHQLVEPLGSMEDRMCKKHNKILELFCRKEQRCICILCSQTDHRSHDVVALEDESGKRKEEMRKTKADCKKYIQERELELQEIRGSAKACKEAAEKETADGVKVLNALVASIQKSIAEVLEVIERKEKDVQQKADQSITELHQEITVLQMTSMECEKLSRSEDHFQVLKYSLPSPSSLPGGIYKVPLDLTAIPPGTVRAAVTKMEKTINEGMAALIKQLEELDHQVTSDPPNLPPTPPPRHRQGSFPQPCSSSIERQSSLQSYINFRLQPQSPKSATIATSSIKPPSLHSSHPKSDSPNPSSKPIPPPLHAKPSPQRNNSQKALSPGEALAQTLTELQQKIGDKK